jgi:hypothetical protein
MASYFFLIFLATIIITRVSTIATKIPSPTIFGFRTHHYMTGIFLCIVAVIFSSNFLGAIGLGLFIDQAPLFFLWRKWKYEDYISIYCYVGIICLTILVFIFQNYIISWL